MTKSEFKAMLDSLAEAWGRRDYVAAAGAFAEGVRYADPLRYSFDSRERLRAFFEADEGRPQRTVWRTIVFDEEQQVGAAEYTYEGTRRYHGTALIKVEGGKVTHWREYQHVDARDWKEFTSGTAF